MSFLLDTHTLIWWWLNDPSLSRRARDLLAARSEVVHISAVSAFEIALKVRAGQLPTMAGPLAQFDEAVRDDSFRHLAVDHDHAIRAGLLEGKHKDPFDRLLAAQALVEGMTVITRDPQITGFGCETFW